MDKNSFDLITFGEIMLRLSPPRHARIVDGDIFEKRAGGAELNVASGVALLGLRTGIVSKLPQNELGTFIKNRIRFVGVSDDYLVYDDTPDARLGLYYYEMGAAPRKPTIVYDRHQASVTRIKMSEIPDDIYHSAISTTPCSTPRAATAPCPHRRWRYLRKACRRSGTQCCFRRCPFRTSYRYRFQTSAE